MKACLVGGELLYSLCVSVCDKQDRVFHTSPVIIDMVYFVWWKRQCHQNSVSVEAFKGSVSRDFQPLFSYGPLINRLRFFSNYFWFAEIFYHRGKLTYSSSVMHTEELISMVWCKPLSLSPWNDAHPEIASVEWCGQHNRQTSLCDKRHKRQTS